MRNKREKGQRTLQSNYFVNILGLNNNIEHDATKIWFSVTLETKQYE